MRNDSDHIQELDELPLGIYTQSTESIRKIVLRVQEWIDELEKELIWQCAIR